MQTLLGTVVRQPITAGEPVTQGSLVSPGDRGFLAAALGPGMRAVTISVSDKTGVAGFVFPGDHVDIMLTQEVEGEEGASLKAAETILANLRVLAPDQSNETTTHAQRSTMPRASAPTPVVVENGTALAAPTVPQGPTVRVTRGKETSVEPVGRGAGALLDRQGQAMVTGARTASAGISTLR